MQRCPIRNLRLLFVKVTTNVTALMNHAKPCLSHYSDFFIQFWNFYGMTRLSQQNTPTKLMFFSQNLLLFESTSLHFLSTRTSAAVLMLNAWKSRNHVNTSSLPAARVRQVQLVNLYRRDPNKSGGGTQSFSITPYSLNGSNILLTCYGGLYLRWIQLAPPWRFLNFHLEHP